MKPNNPFLVYGYHSPAYFCDREQETAKIVSALHNERNLTLIAPRRMGKTGLIKNVFHHICEQEPDTVCFYIDIYSTRDLRAFVLLLGKTILGGLDTLSRGVLRKLTSFFKSCRPVITVDERTGLPSVTIDFVAEQAEQTLKEIMDYMVKSGKRCYIAIDEFQQIADYPETGVEALLRSYIQFMPNVHFIFSGSKMHLMEEMFTSAKRPFYQSTQLVPLKEIAQDVYFSFANAFFEEKKRTLSPDVFEYIYQLAGGHTWYMQVILNRLYESGVKVVTKDSVDRKIDDVLEEQESIYQSQLAMLTNNQVSLMKAIATEGYVKNINSNEFIRKHDLKTPSSVNAALKSLLSKELLCPTTDGYMVYDRFMGMWLKGAIV